MSDPRPSLLLLSLCACGVTEGEEPVLLDRYVEALAASTAEVAAPAVWSGLVLGGVAVELCQRREQGGGEPWVLGAAPPLHEELIRALGEPVVAEVDDQAGAFAALLSGVTLGGPEGALRLSSSPGAVAFEVQAVVLNAIEGGAVVATADLAVAEGCLPGANLVSGSLRRTDGLGRESQLVFPANAGLDAGLAMSSLHPYLPQQGSLGWSGVLEGEDRSLLADDAAKIAIEEGEGSALPFAVWPVLVEGGAWQAAIELELGL